MLLLSAFFTAGFFAGVVFYWLSRKFYWYVKTPQYVRRHFATIGHRRRLSVALRRRRYYPVRPLRSYAGYGSDYRLSKLFEKLDRRSDD